MITEILTDTEEQGCEIRLIVRSDKWGIQIDNTITPLYCCNCKTQLKNLYKLNGGRYGQVGTVKCSCSAAIHCTDSDNRVEYLDILTTLGNTIIGKYHIDFIKLYKLDNSTFFTIKNNLGFDIYKKYANQIIDLKKVIEELEINYELKIENEQDFTFDKFTHLPKIINKWLTILDKITK